ncbi:MAG: hypothetical protein ACTS5A_00720 [Candidatus Hodgkinia cicadicola]
MNRLIFKSITNQSFDCIKVLSGLVIAYLLVGNLTNLSPDVVIATTDSVVRLSFCFPSPSCFLRDCYARICSTKSIAITPLIALFQSF